MTKAEARALAHVAQVMRSAAAGLPETSLIGRELSASATRLLLAAEPLRGPRRVGPAEPAR